MEKVINILVVVDPQNDFIFGSLANEEAQKKVPLIANKIKQRRAEGYRIGFTQDTHGKNYLNTLEGKNLPFIHCVENQWGWQICDEILEVADLDNDFFIKKFTFGDHELYNKIINSLIAKGVIYPDEVNDIRIEIELVGFCTNICVVSNALILKGSGENMVVYVDESCCAGTTPEEHQAAILTMQSCQIIIL